MTEVSRMSHPFTSYSTPIDKLPVEILAEIFKFCAASYPKLPGRRSTDLCLVRKHWNAVANSTPQLWTKINLSFPCEPDHLSAAQRRVVASKQEKIDVSIKLYTALWCNDERSLDSTSVEKTSEFILVGRVLRGTEKRWKSLKVVADAWLPLFKLTKALETAEFQALESISMEQSVPDPEAFDQPVTLLGRLACLPKFCDLSLSAVYLDWDGISASFQGLRRLKIQNRTGGVGLSFEVFAAKVSSLTQLECLDVSGFYPEQHAGPGLPAGGGHIVPTVRLPALKEFTFGWRDVDSGSSFLGMFQIGSSLENLTLLDATSSLGNREGFLRSDHDWSQSSEHIFSTLHELGIAAPGDSNDLPPGPFISLRGVKRLMIGWTKTSPQALNPFLSMLTKLEDITLEDVDKNVLEAVAARATGNCRLRLDFKWMWKRNVPRFAEGIILDLEKAGNKVFARGAGEQAIGSGPLFFNSDFTGLVSIPSRPGTPM